MVNLSTLADWPCLVNTIPSLNYLDFSDCLLASSGQVIAAPANGESQNIINPGLEMIGVKILSLFSYIKPGVHDELVSRPAIALHLYSRPTATLQPPTW